MIPYIKTRIKPRCIPSGALSHKLCDGQNYEYTHVYSPPSRVNGAAEE